MTVILTILVCMLLGILCIVSGFVFGVYMTLLHAPADGTLKMTSEGKLKLDISNASPSKIANQGRLIIQVRLDEDSQEKEPL